MSARSHATIRGGVAALLMATLLLSGCGKPTPPAQEDPPSLNITHWTERTELYAEHPPLVAGHTARFAVHLTRLSDFKALDAGRPRIEFRAADGKVTALQGTPPLRPGAFRVEGTVPPAGQYTWSLTVEAPALNDRHELGAITVYPDEATARRAAENEAATPAIAYLKEQQWTNEFATEVVRTADLRLSFRAPASVAAVSGGEAIVAAPAAGRVAPGRLPDVGTAVTTGQVLARFEPRLEMVGDRATLAAQVAEAQAAVDAAEAERARAERLLAERAVPARRLEDATRALAVARAQLAAAQARLAQRDQTLRSGGGAAGGNVFVLRAPIGGRVAAVLATPGAAYEEGAPLFRIVRTNPVRLKVHIPSGDAARVRAIEDVAIELPGQREPLPLRVRRILNPGVVESDSRALALSVEVDNAAGLLLVGQAGTAVLYTRERQTLPTIPAPAVLADAGRPIVFVQVGGESFERRVIEVAGRDGDRVGVAAGLRPGERVVTRGAYEVLLASAAKGLPAAGHVH